MPRRRRVDNRSHMILFTKVKLPTLRKWRAALGMPMWRVIEASDLCDTVIYKAERGDNVTRPVARLLSIALEVPLELLIRGADPEDEDMQEFARARAEEVQRELAARSAALEARRMAFVRAPAPETPSPIAA
jgi:hypothetical protein